MKLYFSFLICFAVFLMSAWSQVSIKGRVFDYKTFAAVSGAKVIVQGTTLSATTNATGDFTLGATPITLHSAPTSVDISFRAHQLVITSLEPTLCELLNLQGQIVWSNHHQQNGIEEKLLLPSGGIYIYRVTTSTQFKTGRIALTKNTLDISVQTIHNNLSLAKTNAVTVEVTKSGYYTYTKSVNNTETNLQLFITADTSTYCAGRCAPAVGYKLVWASEFDSTAINRNHWGFDLGDGCDQDLCGWGNEEREYYTERTNNVRIESGKLIIEGRSENYQGSQYTSAKMTTKGKKFFRYGRIEAMIKMPQSDAGKVDVALWPAFWMMPQYSKFGGWPRSGELDIVEWGGKNPKLTTGTAHWGNPGTNHPQHGGEVVMPWNLNEGYHLYRIDWDSTMIRWYVDTQQISSLSIAGDMEAGRPFQEEFYIILNLAIGGNWANIDNNPNAANFPTKMYIDWIRVYQK